MEGAGPHPAFEVLELEICTMSWTLVGWQGGRLGGISAGWQGVYVIDCNMTVWDSNQRFA